MNKRLKVSGIVLTVIGIVILLSGVIYFIILYYSYKYINITDQISKTITLLGCLGGGILLLIIGLVLWDRSASTKRIERRVKKIEKSYKRALIGGLVSCGIGIALISWGIFTWFAFAMFIWLMGGLILLYGVLSLVDFIRLKKLAAMSQSDVSKMFACPRCGTVGAIYLIKVVGPKILIKQRCPIHGRRLFRLPLRLRDHCISYFRDTIFRCFKCGQVVTVDHVRFSGRWTLIKVSCPTHGNRLPYHKIWRTVYNDISKEVVVAPQQAQPQPIPSKKIMFCPNCGEKFTGVDQMVCQNCGSKID